MKVAQHVLIAENGQQALALLDQNCPPAVANCPQLILLDMNMPVLNRREFLEAYGQLPAAQRHATVVVILTTSLHQQDRLLAQHFPINDFSSKPLTRAKMNELLARHFPANVA